MVTNKKYTHVDKTNARLENETEPLQASWSNRRGTVSLTFGDKYVVRVAKDKKVMNIEDDTEKAMDMAITVRIANNNHQNFICFQSMLPHH